MCVQASTWRENAGLATRPRVLLCVPPVQGILRLPAKCKMDCIPCETCSICMHTQISRRINACGTGWHAGMRRASVPSAAPQASRVPCPAGPKGLLKESCRSPADMRGSTALLTLFCLLGGEQGGLAPVSFGPDVGCSRHCILEALLQLAPGCPWALACASCARRPPMLLRLSLCVPCQCP